MLSGTSSCSVVGCIQLLNVQVPLLFKQVIDALNVDLASASTVWVVAGSLILGCKSQFLHGRDIWA